jgi:putative PIN family toxin of toxin-antitoxin system
MAGEGTVTVGAVFDCMIFLQGATRATGPAAACLRLVQNSFVRLYLTEDVLAELGDVLTRPQVRKRFPLLTREYVESFLSGLRGVADIVANVPASVTLQRDPKDEKYLNLAIAVGARYLVSRDKDLLDLASEPPNEGRTVRERFPNLAILDPVAFLEALRAGG